MDPFRDDNELIAELQAARPAMRADFAAELDQRAAAGFPRRSGAASGFARLADRLRAIEPRRVLIPAGATALAAVAAVTVVVAEPKSGDEPRPVVRSSSKGAARPATPFMPSLKPYGASLASPASSAGLGLAVQELNRNAHFSPLSRHRDIERSAEVVLGAEPAAVRRDAAKVFETVHANDGIVLSSSIRDGTEGEAGARFELLIPSARLGDALAAFSAVAEVRSRHEATADITAPTVRAGELLRDSRARIDGLLAQLSRADTDAERAAAEAALRAERGHNAFLRSRLSTLQRRANFSRVSLRIETGPAAASAGGDDPGWGLGDALGDAGHILTIAAGVTIVGLAILGPIALIALLAGLANRARIRRARERALA